MHLFNYVVFVNDIQLQRKRNWLAEIYIGVGVNMSIPTK